METPHGELVEALRGSVLDGRGSMAVPLRRALAGQAEVPPALRPYAELVRHRAHQTTDEDVAALLRAGYTEDQVYEITVSAALGAGLDRITAGLRALADHRAALDLSGDAGWAVVPDGAPG